MRTLVALSLAVVASALAGCKSTGVDQASSVAGKLRVLSGELDTGVLKIDGAIGALNQINAKGDLKAQYKAYVSSVDALDSQAAKIRGLRADLTASRDQYVTAWQAQNAAISNPDLRKKGEERKDALVARFTKLSEQSDANRALYDGLIKDLRDVQTYLDHDLNATGVDAIGGSVKQAGKTADKLKEGIKGAAADLKKLADDLDVPPPPPPAAPEAPAKK